MPLNFEYFESAGNAVSNGVFIPANDLIGIVAGEFADNQSVNMKDAKFLYSLLNTLTNGVLSSALGITATLGSITGQTNSLSSKTYTFVTQYYADLENSIVDIMPLPSIGSQVGVGDVVLEDIYPNAVKKAAGDAVSGEGVLIPSSLIASFGGPVHASIDLANDCRKYLIALIRYCINAIEQRSTTVASAITAKTLGATAGVTLPAAATDATNPTTGIIVANLPKFEFFSKTLSVTIQRIENEITQSFDVNVISA